MVKEWKSIKIMKEAVSCFLSFAMYGGEADGSIVDRVTNNINHTRIEFEEDGSFEIKLTANSQG